MECVNGTRANSSHTGCESIPVTSMEWDNVWVIISVILTCSGVIITCLIGGLFYWHKETPIIMASGKELSFVLLGGVLMSYISTFVFVAHPTPFICGATRFLLGVSYTVCYAAILVKTNRIYRVFNIHTSKPKKVKFISAKSQLLITFGIVSVEIAALTSWLIFDQPEVIHEYPTRADNVRVCEDSRDYAYLGALVYPIFLMIVCVYYAVKTRKNTGWVQWNTLRCFWFLLIICTMDCIYFYLLLSGNPHIKSGCALFRVHHQCNSYFDNIVYN